MNEEIKEILADLKDEDKYIEEYNFRYKRIALDDVCLLLDYITNLQEENERLKEVINDDMTTYLKGLEDGKDKMKECYNSVYKSRCEKAIKYIKKHSKTNPSLTGLLVDYEIEELLNILNGGCEE